MSYSVEVCMQLHTSAKLLHVNGINENITVFYLWNVPIEGGMKMITVKLFEKSMVDADNKIMASITLPSEAEEIKGVLRAVGIESPSDCTYNKIFHKFSDPQSDGVGFGGDYEFYIMEHNSSQIMLKGKKTNQRIEMRKLSSDISWSEYLSGIDKMASLVDTKYLDMLLNGESISML